jgi:hypothetical protein
MNSKAKPKKQQKRGCYAERLLEKSASPSDLKNTLPTSEWNFFDRDRVPDEQLIACCYWEYARESNAIREAVKIVKTALANQGKSAPETAEGKAFRVSATRAYGLLNQTRLPLLFWTGLHFPEIPWQSIDKTERKKWANACPEFSTPWRIPPFQITGDHCIAGELYGKAKAAHEKRIALERRLSQIDTGAANLTEAAEVRQKLLEQEKNPAPLLVRGVGGVDFFIAQINWRDFTDNEIIECFKQWVKTKGNRPIPMTQEPKGVRGMQGGRGHKPRDWRASLDRLGIMRLMNRHSFEEITSIVQAAASVTSADREKYSEKSGCIKERTKALKDFHGFFPFLDAEEKPCSWQPLSACW